MMYTPRREAVRKALLRLADEVSSPGGQQALALLEREWQFLSEELERRTPRPALETEALEGDGERG